MPEDMYTHQYYQRRCIIRPSRAEQYMVKAVLVSGLLFVSFSLSALLK